MPPSEGHEPRALTVAAQAIEGRKCAETAKVHPDLRIVYNLAYGVLAGEAGRFSLVGDYTTIFFLVAASTYVDTTPSHALFNMTSAGLLRDFSPHTFSAAVMRLANSAPE